MQIRSNIITRTTVGTAVAGVPNVTFQDTRSRDGWYEPIREFRARDGRNGFEIFLSGSSPYRSQHDRSEHAATWSEWGLVIAALYFVDPDAEIGQYKSLQDFEEQTARAYGKTDAETPWLVAA
jgi:hypothetical protein